MSIIIALLIFSVIIIFHELGHFLMAKLGGIGVTAFSLGMGPTLLKKQIGETEYCLKLFPIGGSCMMVGEDEDSESDNSFQKKGVWTRISVVLGGPVFNFIMAFAGSLIMVVAVGIDKPVIRDTMDGFPAYEAGVRAGDEIVSMNGRKIQLYRDISIYNQLHQGETVNLVYERNGERFETVIKPMQDENGYYLMGITGGAYSKCDGPLEVVSYSAKQVGYWIRSIFDSLKLMFSGKVGREEIGGPVRIVGLIGDTYEQNVKAGAFAVFISLLNMVIFLSANLGVMNLLPIPALDGGRFVFLLIEAVTGKRVPPEKEGYIHFAGFVLLMILMVLIFLNDISQMI